jgi:hypothetical protein
MSGLLAFTDHKCTPARNRFLRVNSADAQNKHRQRYQNKQFLGHIEKDSFKLT